MEEISKTTALKEVKKEKMPAKSNDKLVISIIILFVVLAATGIFGYYFYSTNMITLVKYEGGTVTNSEYAIYYKMFAEMLEYYGYSQDTIPEEIARKVARDEILYNKAQEAGIKYSDEDAKQIEEIFSDKTKTDSFLEKGIDLDRLKKLYYIDATINQYLKKLQTDVTSDEMLTYIKSIYGEDANLKEYVTKQILFKTYDDQTQTMVSDQDKSAIKEKAEGVLKRAQNGEDFAKLVSEFSDDTATKEKGGEYRVYEDERTVEPYLKAVRNLQTGKITPTLVESDYGYHIILLVEVNDTGRTNSEQDRSDYIEEKVNKIVEDSKVEINKANLNAEIEKITGVKAEVNNTVSNDTVNNTVKEVTTENTTTESTNNAVSR